MIENIKAALISKWGFLSAEGNAMVNGIPSYTEPGVRFNYIFNPDQSGQIDEIATSLNFVLPDELRLLYSECNGMRLFLSSLNIYGTQSRQDDMEPFDLLIENYNAHARMKRNSCDNEKLFFFGSCGKDHVFAYDTSNTKTIFCLEKGSDVPVLTFTGLNELFDFFMPRIMDQYDIGCIKKVPNDEFADIPVLANSILSVMDLL